MKRHLLLLFLSLTATRALAVGECSLGEMHPNAPPETSQFAFLIGDFAISLHAWTPNGWTPPRPAPARWNGRWALGGMAIRDEWFDPGPESPEANRGINVRMFDPDARQWKMMWVASSDYQVRDLRAEVRGGVLTMWEVVPGRANWKAEFEQMDTNRWARVSWVREDAQSPWVREFRLAATRIDCEP